MTNARPKGGWSVNRVMVIPDGHRRLANKTGSPLRDIYRKSADVGSMFVDVLLKEYDVREVVFYTMSLRNIESRSEVELAAIFDAFSEGLQSFARTYSSEFPIKIQVVGNRRLWPDSVCRTIDQLPVGPTTGFERQVTFLLAYSGRLELESALRALFRTRRETAVADPDILDQLRPYLAMREPMDIVVRTGGSIRLTDAPILPTLDAELVPLESPFPLVTSDELRLALDKAFTFPQGALRNSTTGPA